MSAACKLNVFDIIGDCSLSSFEIAKRLNLDNKSTSILLKALTQIEFLKEINEKYSLTDLSFHLTEQHPNSLKYACLNWSSEHLNAWQKLDYSISSGKSSFELQYGSNYFQYLRNHPEKLDHYHKAMYEYALVDYKDLTKIIDFSIHKSITDVGGGYGALIGMVKNKYTNIHCNLFDLPEVIENCNNNLFDRTEGNFFESIPLGSDALILSRILHDWHESKASMILTNCYNSLPINGTLYVIENCTDKIKIDLSLLSLNMLSMCESHERTSIEYIELANKSGFKYSGEKTLNDLQTILIFKKS